MNRTAVLYVLIFSLMLNAAAIGSAAFFWWKSLAHASEVPSTSKSLEQFIREDLKLEPSKAEGLMNTMNRRRDEIQKLRSNVRFLRSALMETITSESVNPSDVDNRLSEMGNMQLQIRRACIGTLSEIARSLESEDRKRFGIYLKGRICGCSPMNPVGSAGPLGQLFDGR